MENENGKGVDLVKSITKAVKSISDVMGFLTTIFAVPIMSLFILLIFIGVFTRFVLNIPILATDELCRIGFVWVCFFGAADAFKTKTNIAFMMVLNKVSDNARNILYICIYIACIGFFATMAYYGVHISQQLYENQYAVTGITMSAAYIAIPVSMIIMIFHALNFIFEEYIQLKNRKGGKAA